jgi:hypothetical protein
MRRRIVVLAVAALISVAGCDAAFGTSGSHCHHHGDNGPAPAQPASPSASQDS